MKKLLALSLLLISAQVPFSLRAEENKSLSGINTIAVLPIETLDKKYNLMTPGLVEWIRFNRGKTQKNQQAFLDLLRTHLEYGIHDRGYKVVEEKYLDTIISNEKSLEVKPGNIFAKKGIDAILFSELIEFDDSYIKSTGEVLMKIKLTLVSTHSGEKLWEGINKNTRIYEKKNIVKPNIRAYIDRALRNNLRKLPKAEKA